MQPSARSPVSTEAPDPPGAPEETPMPFMYAMLAGFIGAVAIFLIL